MHHSLGLPPGGEQQRVAIARALANRPKLLLADEPTGQLDSHTGHDVMALIRSIVVSEGTTAVVATHDPALIDLADRVIELRDGRIVEAGEAFAHPVTSTASPGAGAASPGAG